MRFMPFLAAIVVAAGVQQSTAQSVPQLDDIVQIDLIDGWTDDNGAQVGALRVTLAPGWKTYWRVGGESGIPPVFDWSRSENLASVAYHWPRPELIEQDGMLILGFHNQLVLPITFTPKDKSRRIEAEAVLDLGVCREVCIPIRADLQSHLGVGNADARFLIELALAELPQTAAHAGLPKARCRISRKADGFSVEARLNAPEAFGRNYVLVLETDRPDAWIAPAHAIRQDADLVASATVMDYSGKPDMLTASDLRLTLVSPQMSVDLGACADE